MPSGRIACAAAVLAVCACGPARPPAPGPSSPPSSLSPEDMSRPLPVPLPEVAARVNGQPIPTRNVAIAARGGAAAIRDEQKPLLMRQALYKLIVRELLFEEAVARGLKPDERVLARAYDEARVGHKDEALWTEYLRQQGLDPAAFRTELRVQHTVQALLAQEEAALPAVTDEEAKAYYDAHPQEFETGERLRASHILVRAPADMTELRKAELRTRVGNLVARLRKGEDFETLARQSSEDAGSKGRGGRLDVFSRGQMHPQFEQAAFALQPGQISDVVETPFGFHVIKLHERLPSQKLPFEAVRERLKQHVLELRRAERLEALAARLRAKARIEVAL